MKKILNHNTLYLIPTTFILLFPALVSAQSRVTELIDIARDWLGLLVYIVIGIAIVLFFWGIIKYVIAGAGNEEGRQQGRNLIVYGIIGIFVMVAIWGLVYLVGGVLGVGIGGTPDLPNLPGGDIAPAGSTALLDIIAKIGGWIADVAILLIGLALLLFLWGVARYVASGADEEKRTESRKVMLYGVIGLFSMVAIWGLVYLVGNTLGVTIGGGGVVPQITDPKLGGGVRMDASTCPTWDPNSNNKANINFIAFVCLILKVLKPIPPILVALAVLYFFWGIAKYMNSGGDAEKLQNGRITILYGILGMFVLVAVWGIVYLVQRELGLG